MEIFKDFIKAVYSKYDVISSSRNDSFDISKEIVRNICDDLLSTPNKTCIVISFTSFTSDDINEVFYRFIDSGMIENRTKNKIIFKNGSIVRFITQYTLINMISIPVYIDRCDILFADWIGAKDFSEYNFHNFFDYRKVILGNLVDDKTRQMFMGKLDPLRESIYDLSHINRQKIIIGLRKIKLGKIKTRV
jgi:hypothetical protein